MDKLSAKNLVRTTLKAEFDEHRFRNFVNELCNGFDQSTSYSSHTVPDVFSPYVVSWRRVGTFSSSAGDLTDILVVHLTDAHRLERARTALRDFIAWTLKRNETYCEAGLVAFVAPDHQSWRFSLVRMLYETSRDLISGKIKLQEHLTSARRYSYLVGAGEQCHTAQSRFLALLQDTSGKPDLSDLEDAFSVEAVTSEFFDEYSRLFTETAEAVSALEVAHDTIAREFRAKGIKSGDFAKKLLGQIAFLYFIQKKGWLGVERSSKWGTGPRDFTRRIADRAIREGKCFFSDVLEPLFYEVFSTDRGLDAWSDQLKSRIPFLNGGLFEPLKGYDWLTTRLQLPNAVFTNQMMSKQGDAGSGILDVFDRYNFTVNEAEPLEKDVAIDPEMLGKIFENLIEENFRKGVGAYYTPREIVQYMCKESLINYLGTALNSQSEPDGEKEKQTLLGGEKVEDTLLSAPTCRELVSRVDLETLIRLGDRISYYEAVETHDAIKMPARVIEHARLIDEQLAEITVCDPAVGSGAFPVGMMTEIVRARSALTPYFNDIHERMPYDFKRHAIQNSLYGVDIDPGAVEIAKLRLWLSLVVDEEDVKHIKPLPNLDYKVVVGNSLIGFPFKSAKYVELETLKLQFFNEADHDKKEALKAVIELKLAERFSASKRTFGYEVSFDFNIMFSEVFNQRGGFDVVIANPPYLGEKGHKETFRQIAASPWGARYYKRKMDLFYFFFHLAMDLVKLNGSVCFITTSYWITADGAIKLRLDLKARATLLQLLNFGELKLFGSAQGQHNMITHMDRSRTERAVETLITRREGEATPMLIRSILGRTDTATSYYEIEQQNLFDGDENHVRLTPTIANCSYEVTTTIDFTKIDGLSAPLFDYAQSVFMGVQTGCDEVTTQLLEAAIEKKLISRSEARRWSPGVGIYVLSNEEVEQLRLTPKEERDCLKPFYKNSDIERYYTPRKDARFLLYVDSKTDIKLYPNIKQHLEQFRPLLAAREQAVTESRNWFWIRGSKRDSYYYRPDTVVVPYRAKSSRFSVCNQDIFGAGDLYYISLKRQYSNRALLGFLNSSLVLYHLLHRGKRKGKAIEYYKNPLEKIPVHKRLFEDAGWFSTFERIVDRILAEKQRDPNADTRALERTIDESVFALYSLTPEEIKIVNDSTSLERTANRL